MIMLKESALDMKLSTLFTTFTLIFVVVDSAIVFPDELSTITGILYSILPPVKIGQDSRLGVGFRVGPNADAQVLLELGPQSNTVPLEGSASKRQAQRERPSYTKAEREQILRSLLDRMRNSLRPETTKKMEKEKVEKS